MGKLYLIGGLLLCVMYGSQVEGYGRAQHRLKQPNGASLEDELRDLRMELERLNVTHQIPGICSVCKWVLGKTINIIPENDTKEHLKSVLEASCSAYGLFALICRTFVNGYFVKIFIEIVQHHVRDPSTICKALHLCWWQATENDF
ncbi:prosaposin-like [Sardina pilchardus]|uniref:prosaposin-like n=1 Tax=Sardina pilchardus TaxID=27697 RepID=UPI002E152534